MTFKIAAVAYGLSVAPVYIRMVILLDELLSFFGNSVVFSPYSEWNDALLLSRAQFRDFMNSFADLCLMT